MATTGPDGTWYQCANCGRPWAQHREGGASPGCNCPGYRAGVTVSPVAQAMAKLGTCAKAGPAGRSCERPPHPADRQHWAGTGMALYQWTDDDWGPAPVSYPADNAVKATAPPEPQLDLAAECRHCGRAISGTPLANGSVRWTDAGGWHVCTQDQPHQPPPDRPGEHRCPHCQRMHAYPVPIHPFRGRADRGCDDCGKPDRAEIHLRSLIPRTTL